jgi:hypothetical protein
MSLDRYWLSLRVEGSSQTISHDSGHALRFRAKTKENEEIELGTEGRRLSNILVELSVVRGKPERVLERGIGRINYHPKTAPSYDSDGIEEFVGGWFWLPEGARPLIGAAALKAIPTRSVPKSSGRRRLRRCD